MRQRSESVLEFLEERPYPARCVEQRVQNRVDRVSHLLEPATYASVSAAMAWRSRSSCQKDTDLPSHTTGVCWSYDDILGQSDAIGTDPVESPLAIWEPPLLRVNRALPIQRLRK